MFGNFYFEVKKNKKKNALNDSVVNSTDPTAAINNLLIQ